MANCQANCTDSLFAEHTDVIACQLACTNFPAESCRVDCFHRFAAGTVHSKCLAACASLCNLAADSLSYLTGVSPWSGRTFCPAAKLPVCLLSEGSPAQGRCVVLLWIICFPIGIRDTVLPVGRILGRRTQKWPCNNTWGLGNQRPRLWPNFKYHNCGLILTIIGPIICIYIFSYHKMKMRAVTILNRTLN